MPFKHSIRWTLSFNELIANPASSAEDTRTSKIAYEELSNRLGEVAFVLRPAAINHKDRNGE